MTAGYCSVKPDSRYCGSRLSDWDNGVYRIAFPMPEENNGNGTVSPAFSLPGSTPWRTVTVGETLKPIVETTVPWDVVEPRYTTTHDYKPGRGTWLDSLAGRQHQLRRPGALC